MKQKREKDGLDLVVVMKLENFKRYFGRRIDSIYLWIGYEIYEEVIN